MSLVKIIVLAIIQGLAELLPVSSSAHVVVAEKLMGLNASTPEMTLLLVMLHTGTMFAVIVYFWKRWRRTYFDTANDGKRILVRLIWATVLTGILGEILIKAIEKTVLKGVPHAEIEDLFNHLEWIAPALAAAGILILIAGIREGRRVRASREARPREITMRQAGWIGAIQGVCLPFRGFSRSGATISTGMLLGASRERTEVFSFALAVILTPAAIGRELLRVVHAQHAGVHVALGAVIAPSLLGMLFSFIAGLLALKWLSRWLENGRWYLFGIYCLAAAGAVAYLHHIGY